MSAASTSAATNGASSSSSAVAPAAASKPAVQPSEVGWLFVTQFYTFLNQNPGRLHCFFTKKSTMIHGTEQVDTSACFGQQQIHDKIISLGFQDAKVFVSNVDSQSSASGGIIVQVLGELSNNGGAWRKFAQTFFLAEQPNGYFVLNDIFRYLKDEEETEAEAIDVDEAIQDEIDQADKDGKEVVHQIEINNVADKNALPHLPAPPASAAAAAAASSTNAKPIEPATTEDSSAVTAAEPAQDSSASAAVDQATATATATDFEPTKADADQVGVDKKVTAVEPEQAPAPTKGAQDAAAAATTTTTTDSAAAAAAPAAAAPAPAPAPVTPAAPPKPKTWATLAASDATRWGSNVSSEAKGVSSSRPTPAPAAQKPAGAAAAKPNAGAAPSAGAGAGAGASAGAASNSVYVKNVVADQVTEAALRQALEAFGTVKDVSINPTRSCAFAEYTSVDSAKKAVAKGQVSVGKNGWSVTVEERRRPAAGGAGAAGGRGGSSQRGGARGGSSSAPRGGNAQRGGAARGGRPAASSN
ncbi:hypothetical protein BCV70DRAFT_197635 [Testicularia cyperi]|uniref:NTF2-domain-containing protein n=1 Tax=Testicularia cyperi TaxID=1882483 RepID=A0A317Y039_9BASI|nr:hypothetical protein BCV70DRAFT_197635 [Testicularia cyperi]